MVRSIDNKLTPIQSFFLILIFVVGGFSIILLSILNPNSVDDVDTLEGINLTNSQGVEEDVVLKNNFDEFGVLFYSNVSGFVFEVNLSR